MIGVLLQSARKSEDMSLEDLSEATKISIAELSQYEIGEAVIPMHQLTTLASAVNRNMDYFLETSGFVGELLQMRAEWQKFMDLDEDVRKFASNQTNLGFLKIAMMFSHMPTAELRQVAEGMLEITM